MVSQEERKQEAIKRMEALGLHKDCINAFKNKNEVWVSEWMGTLFDMSQRQKMLKQIEEISKKYNLLVYHIIFTPTEIGDMLSLLYVSEEKDEWKLDWDDMKYNEVMCYVINLSDDILSEFGRIAYKKANGGLIRTA